MAKASSSLVRFTRWARLHDRGSAPWVVSSPGGGLSFCRRAHPLSVRSDVSWNVTTIYLTVPSEIITVGAASEKRVVLGFTLGTV